jgi:polysaccharide export outer membrane protein
VDFEATIQPHDIISIFVTSLSPEASSFFNTMSITERPQSGDNFTTRPNVGYLVDAYGDIEMPLVGKMHIGGYTTQVARDTIASRLEKFLQYPTVRLYIENFRVTILGEVYRPGVYSVTNEKITIPEALGQAGDMTIYGNRKKVLLVREENGIKSYINIDLTRRDLFSSPYYYLHSGDILYCTPVRDRVASADNFYRITPIIIAALTLLGVIALRFAGK